MDRKFINFAVMLLAFGVGLAFAGFSFFGGDVHPVEVPEEPPVVETRADGGQTLEMVFVLDTTGSMGGLLDAAKQKIWGIVNDVMQKQSRPSVRVGLVAYRDNGDAYVTQIVPVTSDLDTVYTSLMEFQAGGGGDSPENVRRALAEGVRKAGWSEAKGGVAQVIFLVGDAPPQNYQSEPDVLVTAAEAVRKNMIVNTIQCGNDAGAREAWQQIARAGQGKYFAIAQDGGVETINTPYDERLSQLGREIGGTYMAYGESESQAARTRSVAATETAVANSASNTARADRALNKALNKEGYVDDFIQDLEKGKTRLQDVKVENLPAPLQKMPEAERSKEVEKRIAERKKIRDEILSLSKQRDAFIAAERKRSGKGGGFDSAVQTALGEQLAKRGIK
jgi:Mg-chelatase subunit ChlD